MYKSRHMILLILLAAITTTLKAQDNELALRLQMGHNAVFGGFAAASVETVQTFECDFMLNAGAQYNTIGKTSIEARPGYFHDFSWGRLSAETLLAYTGISSVNSIAAGAGMGLSGKWLSGRLGYYYRMYGGGAGWIKEAFNVYYELNADLLQKIDDWNLRLTITNCEIFELERHFQPSFIALCNHYPQEHIGISFGVGCKPAGMFNMSADNYQSYIKAGICYRW